MKSKDNQSGSRGCKWSSLNTPGIVYHALLFKVEARITESENSPRNRQRLGHECQELGEGCEKTVLFLRNFWYRAVYSSTNPAVNNSGRGGKDQAAFKTGHPAQESRIDNCREQ